MDLVDCQDTVRCYTTEDYYLCMRVMYFCCCSVRCYSPVAAAAVLQLAAAVRHRVPGDKICCCGCYILQQ